MVIPGPSRSPLMATFYRILPGTVKFYWSRTWGEQCRLTRKQPWDDNHQVMRPPGEPESQPNRRHSPDSVPRWYHVAFMLKMVRSRPWKLLMS